MEQDQESLWPEGLDSLEAWARREDLTGLDVYGVTGGRLGRVASVEEADGRLAACEVELDPAARQAHRWTRDTARVPAGEWATRREDGLHLAVDPDELVGGVKVRKRRREAAQGALRT